MGSTEEDVELDPPNELIDTSCSRMGSIGTLTSWQLLAAQHAGAIDDDDDDEPTQPASSPPRKPGSLQITDELQCSPRTSSWTSGCATPRGVTARPHHAFYKEYRCLETIGKGAFGTVSLAVRRSDGKQLVAKEISSTQASLASAKQREAVYGEVDVLSRLRHPNVVKYHECFVEANNVLIIVMEHCNAGDLAQMIKRQANKLLPESSVMFMFVQICLGMNHVHAQGIMHRDLKTSNILANKPSPKPSTGTSTPVSRTSSCVPDSANPSPSTSDFNSLGLLKLADFGVARQGCDTDGSMAGSTVGTPCYLSPEMCDGKRYSKKTDVWALGCILYEIACLRKAFEAANIGGIYRKIASVDYAPLPDCYSSGLKHLVSSLLSKEPRDRPSVAEILTLPYVQQHLAAYLNWARTTPEAQPEVLLASISAADGAMSPRLCASRVGSQRLPTPPLLERGASGACVSSSTVQAAAQCSAGVGSASSNNTAADSTPPACGSVQHRPPAVVVPADSAGSTPERTTPSSAAAAGGRSPAATGSHSSAQRAAAAQHSSTTTAGSAAALTPVQPAAVQLGLDNTTTYPLMEPAASKPNPFFKAAQAMAALPGTGSLGQLAAAALAADAALPVAAAGSGAWPQGLKINKQKAPAGGVSHSLDIWASSNKEPSAELIQAFRTNMLELATAGSGARRLSSAASSPSSTPRSPLHHHHGSLDAQNSGKPESKSEEVTAAGQVVMISASTYEPDEQPGAPKASVRCSARTCAAAHSADDLELQPQSAPLPWLASTAAGGATVRQPSADKWLAALVQSLEQLQHEASSGAAPQLSAYNPQAAAPAVAGFSKGWDPSMVCINQASLSVGVREPGGAGSTGGGIPTSLHAWMEGDGNLLQHLQKRSTRSTRATHSNQLSPLGSGLVQGKALRSSGGSFTIAPVGAASHLQAEPDNQIATSSTTSTSTSTTAAATAGPVPDSAREPPALAAEQEGMAALATQAGEAVAPEWKEERDTPQSVSVLAAADSDLQLAMMFKQCLSGNSFLYTRGPSIVSPAQGDWPSTDSGPEKQTKQTTTTSGSKESDGGLRQQDRAQLGDQAAASMLAEQQEAVQRFNAFRASLGITPGQTRHCRVNHCIV